MSNQQEPLHWTAHVQVVVLITCYNGRDYIEDCLRSVLASEDPGIDTRVVVVDNASQDGTAEYVATAFPQVDLGAEPVNRGYAGGANAGWLYAQNAYPETRFLVLLNQDTIVSNGWLSPLIFFLQQHRRVGVVGPKIMLHPETHKINTNGNRCHYLGFGFVTDYDQVDQGRADRPQPVDFVSGAASMVRTALLKSVGLFDERLFMYLEDVDLSWKLRQIGYDAYVVPSSVVYHQYNPTAPLSNYYYMERNRWILLLTYYKLATLALLLPALAVMEFGQLLFALGHGLLPQKLGSHGFFWRRANLLQLWRQRRLIQQRRTRGDRYFMGGFSGTIDFAPINGFLLQWVANPLLNAYWKCVRWLIFW